MVPKMAFLLSIKARICLWASSTLCMDAMSSLACSIGNLESTFLSSIGHAIESGEVDLSDADVARYSSVISDNVFRTMSGPSEVGDCIISGVDSGV